MNPFDDIPVFTEPHVRKKIHNERRKIRMQAAIAKGNHTDEQWFSLVHSLNYCCAKCRQPRFLHKDHITPIYKGGSNSIENIQPLCQSCNDSKGSDETDWRKDQKL